MSEKRPWVNYSHIWKSESEYMAFIRGGVRKAIWNRYPIKIEYTKANRKRIVNPNPKGKVATVWGGTCYLCDKDFAQKDLQVDHKEGHHSLKTMADIETFLTGLLFLTVDDLAFVCKPCHKAKSYSERMEIPFEEAKATKEAIQIEKAGVDKIVIEEAGAKPGSNAKIRRKQLVEILMQKQEGK